MPDFVATLFINDNASSYGWSENYYLKDEDNIVDAADLFATIVPERLAVLTDLHTAVAARVSQIDIPNDSRLLTGFPAVGDLAATFDTQVQPWTALLTRNEATSLSRGRTFFHGVLEDTFTAGRVYNPTNPNNAAWQTLFTSIKDHCALRHIVADSVTLSDFSAVLPLRQVNRKVGRPFGLLRGRRPTTA